MKTTILPLPTSAEIDRRLEIVPQLRNLCPGLGRAKPLAQPDQESASGEEAVEPNEPRSVEKRPV